MTQWLHISKDLALPAQAVTETFGLLAVRGAGKTNAARVMAEEMFVAALPFVAVDPVGSWFGLRSSCDGKRPGLPIPIFGGKHGDVPLERGGGQLMADLVVDQRLSCVLDLSRFDSEASKKAFLLDFARRLYQRNEEPLHLFLEEADDYIPQRPMRDETHLLRAWENIVRRGRARGIGVTLITQRSASINKSVLTQVQTLIAMRTTGPQDRAAIEDWLKYHAQGREILESLAGLDSGEAWVWSPQFLKKTARIRFRLSDTLDSGETPKAGRSSRPTATLADVDLDGVRARMAETIERAKAEDPRELQKRIAALQKQLAEVPAGPVAEVPVFRTGEVDRLEAMASELVAAAEQLAQRQEAVASEITAALTAIQRALSARGVGAAPNARPTPAVGGGRRPTQPSRPAPAVVDPNAEDAPSTGEGNIARRLLVALAQSPDGLTHRKLAILAAVKRGGSTWRAGMARLRSTAWIVEAGDTATITTAGAAAVGSYTPLPTGQALVRYWQGRLKQSAARKAFDVLVAAYPHALTREELCERMGGIEVGGSTMRAALAKLRGLELIRRDELRASEELFA